MLGLYPQYSNPGKAVTRYQFSKLFRTAWEKGLTMTNIIAGFQTTGIYPFNRSAVDLSGYHGVPEKRLSLTQRTGLQFIPMFTPLKSTQTSPKPPVFDSGEMELYERRYEEGYDVPDKRYEQWVKMYRPKSTCPDSPVPLGQTPVCEVESVDLDHTYDPEVVSAEQPASSTLSSSVSFLPRLSQLSRLLADRAPTVKTTQKRLMGGSRVLTSAENLSSLREKERKKKEEAELKEKRRMEREQRRIKIDKEKEMKRLANQQRRSISQVHQVKREGIA